MHNQQAPQGIHAIKQDGGDEICLYLKSFKELNMAFRQVSLINIMRRKDFTLLIFPAEISLKASIFDLSIQG